jgi:hypothetical protein
MSTKDDKDDDKDDDKVEEDQKKLIRMNIIYKALEDGWSVRKSGTDSRTFEFTKNKSLENDYKGLVIFSKSNICDDIQKHLENIKRSDDKKTDKKPDTKRSVSTPIIKNG